MTVVALRPVGSAEKLLSEYRDALQNAEAGDELAQRRCDNLLAATIEDFIEHVEAYVAHALVGAAVAKVEVDFQGDIYVGEGTVEGINGKVPVMVPVDISAS